MQSGMVHVYYSLSIDLCHKNELAMIDSQSRTSSNQSMRVA